MKSGHKGSFDVFWLLLAIVGLMSMSKKSKRFKHASKTPETERKGGQSEKVNVPIPVRDLTLIFPNFPKGEHQPDDDQGESVIWKYAKNTGILAGIVYAVVTVLLWHDANRNFAIDQRPWVGPLGIISTVQGDSKPTVDILIKNTGKTPAFDIRAENLIDTFGTGAFRPVWHLPPQIVRVGNLFPGGTIHLQMEGSDVIPQQNFEYSFQTGISSVYAYSFLTYRDGLGKTHRTEMCFRHDSTYSTDANVGCPEGYNFAD